MQESPNTVFLSKFCNIYKGIEKKRLNKLRDTLKHVINESLFDLEKERIQVTRDIRGTKKLNLNIKNDFLLVAQNYRERAQTNVIAPSWQDILSKKRAKSNDIVYDIVREFFWLLNQYIYRSKQVNLTIGLSIEYNKFFDFRGSSIRYLRINDARLFNFSNTEFNRNIVESRKMKSITRLLNVINCLDPYVHTSSFYFMRALKLRKKGFYQESITCLSNMLESMNNFFIQNKITQHKDIVKTVCSNLNSSANTTKVMNHIHELRCKATAHSTRSYWWDFEENNKDDIEKLFHHAAIVLRKFFHFEFHNRTIEANPNNWAEWFSKYSHIMIDIIWNDDYPSLLNYR